eukprot:9472550-Prorocentrum_lima.AAC.1
MTSSLVGSEMCIRDSYCPAGQPTCAAAPGSGSGKRRLHTLHRRICGFPARYACAFGPLAEA